MSVDIDTLLAVPDDVEVAINHWIAARAAISSAHASVLAASGNNHAERMKTYQQCQERVALAWQAIGRAVEEHVAERVNEALRLERGGCRYCPAARGEAHNLDCGRPRKG